MNAVEAKKIVNRALAAAGSNGLNARSALKQNKAGFLVEMETDAGATWLMDPENARTFCNMLGSGITIKQRPYNVLVYNAPTTLDPGSTDHLKEILETNNINEGGITRRTE